MEDSYRQPLILEPGNCQEGKYEEKGEEEVERLGKGKEFIPQNTLAVSEIPLENVCMCLWRSRGNDRANPVGSAYHVV